jgi:hypothetical protein
VELLPECNCSTRDIDLFCAECSSLVELVVMRYSNKEPTISIRANMSRIFLVEVGFEFRR